MQRPFLLVRRGSRPSLFRCGASFPLTAVPKGSDGSFDATCATNGVAYEPSTNILLGFNEPGEVSGLPETKAERGDNDKCANLSPAAAAAA